MKTFLLSSLLVCVLSIGSVAQDVPRLISYQGFLTHPNGEPLSGLFDVTVSITDGTGTVKWAETHPSVPVEGGRFDLVIGTINPLDAEIWPGDRLLVSIGDEDLLPSTLFTSTPFALNSGQLGGLPPSGYLRRNTEESTQGSTEDALLRVENTGTGRGMTVISAASHGLYAKSSSGLAGVEGEGAGTGPGVRGSSVGNHGTIGFSSATDKAGVFGNAEFGKGVWGNSVHGAGVYGYSAESSGMFAKTISTNESVSALYAINESNGSGVYGFSHGRYGVAGVTESTNTSDAGVFASNSGGGPAVYSDGQLYVANGGIFIAGGNLYAQGAFTGDVGSGGAPFPRPAFDSGWIPVLGEVDVRLGVGLTLPLSSYSHDNFVIDVVTRGPPNYYITNRYSGDEVYYFIETNNDITVHSTGDSSVASFRLRVWYYR